MMLKDIAIRVAKKSYRVISSKKFYPPECICDRQIANDHIYNLLSKGQPCMISRFGTTEINCVNNYICIHNPKSYIKKCIDYITDYTHTPWWNEDHFYWMDIYSGIFPRGIATAEKFSERYIQDIPEIDLLGSHQYYEKFMPLREDIIKVQLEVLYPFFTERPWTRILEGKKVLVIHPFEETIIQQYSIKEKLFDNPNILPNFELKTFKSVQSIAGNQTNFKDWFEALAYMEIEISKIDFDISIIGCGAYGLPLAAFIKRLGKQAVHLAGGTQLLFGILGKRWVEQYEDILHYRPNIDINTNYRSLFNKYWRYPLTCDVPSNAQKVENACYWK